MRQLLSTPNKILHAPSFSFIFSRNFKFIGLRKYFIEYRKQLPCLYANIIQERKPAYQRRWIPKSSTIRKENDDDWNCMDINVDEGHCEDFKKSLVGRMYNASRFQSAHEAFIMEGL